MGVLGGERLAGGLVGDDHAAVELARADPQEGDAVAVGLVHVGLHLEDDAGERRVERPGVALAIDAGRGRRHEVDHRVEDHAHAEVRERRAEEHRRELAGFEALPVEAAVHDVEQLDALLGLEPEVALFRFGTGGVDDLLGRLVGATGGAGVADEVAAGAIDQTTEALALTDRPVHRHGLEDELLLDLVEEFERVAAGTVPLVDERDDRDLAVAADLEQLAGLGLDALRAVEHHDRRVGGGEHAVRVLGEVAVTRCVQQVQDLLAVRELQHGRGDRDAALLLELHPVRRGGAAIALGLHRTGAADRTAVEQELLGEGGLARVGVRDDRERAPASGLGRGSGHGFRLERGDRTGAGRSGTVWRMTWLVVTIVFTTVMSFVPRLVLARVRGGAYTHLLGAGPQFVPTDDHGGLRRVNLGLDQFTAGIVVARLRDDGVDVQTYGVDGGQWGGSNTVHTMLFRPEDERRVLDVLADVAARAAGD